MAKTFVNKPLGFVLQKAGLVSSEQIKIALKDQVHLPNHKIGELLAIRGWIKPETADFFAEEWSKIVLEKPKQPIGQYFKAAALIDEEQIAFILKEQQRTGLKFGVLAVLQGLIEQKTLDFFLEQLELKEPSASDTEDLFKLQSNPRESAAGRQKLLTTIERSRDLSSVANYLLHNNKCEPVALLKLYQQIWQQGEALASGSLEEIELIKSGLIVRQNHKVKIAKPIYQSIFNQSWIEQELARLEPYSKIRLKLFGLETKASLPYKVLTEVRFWAGNQPFLTQKLYQLIQAQESFIPKGQEAAIVETLVQTHIIDNWENQSAAEHLKALRERLIHNEKGSSINLLKAYKKIWQRRESLADSSPEQAELLACGLIREQQGKVSIANRIYQSVFNQSWIDQQIAMLVQPGNNQVITKEQPSQPVIKEQASRTSKRIKILLLILGLLGLGSLALFSFNLWRKNQEVQLFYQANSLLQQKEYKDALDAYNRIVSLNANYYQAWTNRGYALAGLKQYKEMAESCRSATVIAPHAEYAWNCQGEALHNLGNYPQAITAFEDAIAVNPQEPIFWMNKGESLSKLKQPEEALLAMNQAIDLLENLEKIEGIKDVKDHFTIAFYQKGQILLKLELYSQALDAYQNALNYQKDYLPAQWGRGIALYKLGEHTEARKIFDNIIQRQDLSVEQQAVTLFYQGLYLCEANESDSGRTKLNQALELKPDYQAAQEALEQCN